MRKWLIAFLLAALPTAAWAVYCGQYSTPGGSVPPPGNQLTWASQVVGTCHYWVAASGGSDGNTGLSPATPFATLTKAQTSMQANQNPAQKNTCLLAGTYNLSATLVLGTADSGEVWQFDSRGNGDTAILDGGSAHDLIQIDGNNITINGLVLQNGLSFDIHHDNGTTITGIVISNNDISLNHSFSENGFPGLIHINGVNGITISHNYVHDGISQGIALNAFQAGLQIDNVVVDSNVVLRTCLQNSDCGGIYMEDPGNGGASGANFISSSIKFSNNFVRDIGSGTDAHTIYLDLGSNHVSVFNNVLGSTNPAAGGSSGCMITDGFNDSFFNNICDTGTTGHDWAGLWWFETPPGFTIQNLNYSGNIILGNFAGNVTTNSFGIVGTEFGQLQGTASSYTIAGNFYHNYGGGQELTSGNIASDTNPIHVAAANLKCTGYLYALDPSSQVFSQGFTALPGGWGPPLFVVPTSANHSCPG